MKETLTRARAAPLASASAVLITTTRLKMMSRVTDSLRDFVQASGISFKPRVPTTRALVSFVCGIVVGGLVVSVVGSPVRSRGSRTTSMLTGPEVAIEEQRAVQASPLAEPLVLSTPVESPRKAVVADELRETRIERGSNDAGPARVARESPARSRDNLFRGSLSVSSSPAGAEVMMNGSPVGTTPLLLANVPVGSRVIQVRLDGYQPWSSGVRIVADTRTSVRATLVRALLR